MAERAHPDSPGFASKWTVRLRYGFLPWIVVSSDPYRREFYWRYRWALTYCEGQDVLDVPCGMGWGTSLVKRTRLLIGLDVSVDAIREANRRYGRFAKFLAGDMGHLPFDANSFDVVLCLEGIEHVARSAGERFLCEASRVLRPGGKLLLSSPYPVSGKHSGNPYHLYEYPADEMRELLAENFLVRDELTRQVDSVLVTYYSAIKCGR